MEDSGIPFQEEAISEGHVILGVARLFYGSAAALVTYTARQLHSGHTLVKVIENHFKIRKE